MCEKDDFFFALVFTMAMILAVSSENMYFFFYLFRMEKRQILTELLELVNNNTRYNCWTTKTNIITSLDHI